MNETEVKKKVEAWLADKRYTLVVPEFSIAGNRLDFLAARWLEGGYEITIVGVECKGETHAAEVWGIANEQLGRYARYVPKLYFACSTGKQAGQFEVLCRAVGVGFIGVKPDGAELKHDPVGDVGPRLDWECYMDVRVRVALFLAFEEVFGGELRLGQDWCTRMGERPDRVHWSGNFSRSEGRCYLNVNVEHSRYMFGESNLSEILRMVGELRQEAKCEAWLNVWVGPGRRAIMPLRMGSAGLLTMNELEHLKEVSSTKAIGFSISLPVWDRNQAFGQELHRQRIREAKEVLDALYKCMGGQPVG